MVRIYLAAPLFCKAELDFNVSLADMLRKNGHDVFLPQEAVGEIPSDPEGLEAFKKRAFSTDISEIDACDVIVMVLDGRVPDEGASFELGYAYAKGKLCMGLKTDMRISELGGDNVMLSVPIGEGLARSIPELLMMLDGM